MQKKRNGCLWGLLGVILALVLVLGLLAFLVLQGRLAASPKADLPEWLRPRAAAVGEEEPAAIPTYVAATPTTAPNAVVVQDITLEGLVAGEVLAEPGQVVEVHMSEATVQNEIAGYLQENPNPNYQHESIRLENDQITLRGKAQYNGLTADVELTASAYVDDCWLGIEVREMKVAGVSAPQFVIDQVAGVIRQWTESYRQNPPVCVENITLVDGQMVFVGREK